MRYTAGGIAPAGALSALAGGGITVSGGVVTFGADICDTADDVVRYLCIR